MVLWVPPGGGFQPGHFMERYFCHSTKGTKNEGVTDPFLMCVIFSDAYCVGLMHFVFVLRCGKLRVIIIV